MTRQFSTTVRNDLAGRLEVVVGASPTLEIRSGAPPASCASADSGTLLASLALPADWLGAASAGAVASTATWTLYGSASGTAAHYRIKASGGTCHEQGTVTATGGGGDMTLNSTTIVPLAAISITAYSFGVGGA